MSLIKQKQQIFGNIAALRTLNDGLPTLNKSSSFPSINNKGNSIEFLTDLTKSLVGYKALNETITEILTNTIKIIQDEIKNALSNELKSIVSCGVNPNVPSFMNSNSDGIVIPLKKIDFNDILKIDPRSDGGKLIYDDITPNLIDSTDLNTFLYQTVQNDGSIENWGAKKLGTNIMGIKFQSLDVTQVNPNNSITIKTTPNYDLKSLIDFNNQYLKSIEIFNTENLITNIVDMVFGTVSSKVNKTISQLESEAKVNDVISKIMNAQSGDIISDKFFEFTDKEKKTQELQAIARKNATKIFNTENPFKANINFDSLNNYKDQISKSKDLVAKKFAVSNTINDLSNQVSSFSLNGLDVESLKLNFIQEMIDNIIKAIVGAILSPKILLIFLVNYKIVYGIKTEFDNPIDFLKKNKNLIDSIIKKVSSLIIKALMNLVMKRITELVAQSAAKKLKEKVDLNKTQLLSLVGVPQDTLRQIRGLI